MTDFFFSILFGSLKFFLTFVIHINHFSKIKIMTTVGKLPNSNSNTEATETTVTNVDSLDFSVNPRFATFFIRVAPSGASAVELFKQDSFGVGMLVSRLLWICQKHFSLSNKDMRFSSSGDMLLMSFSLDEPSEFSLIRDVIGSIIEDIPSAFYHDIKKIVSEEGCKSSVFTSHFIVQLVDVQIFAPSLMRSGR